ncbi:MAG: DUF3570 domain-containing protein [Emticicia sp.]|uniref:DUF3570 domain-containing protein n=1 Tax=Emticicia sp. TaxID=1930953 RepID=UPI003BA4FAA6
MKKVTLAIGLYVGILSGAYGQYDETKFIFKNKKTETTNKNSMPTSSKEYKLSSKPEAESGFRTLKLEEVNFVSAYYNQDGNHSAVTGGVGTEKLIDFANSIDLKLSFTDKKGRKHSIIGEAAIDYYSSASSDKIDPRSVSSASMSDVHFYPTLSWSRKDDKKHNSVGASFSYSTEWDYQSYGGNLSFSKSSKDNNTELSVKLGAFFDTWSVILPYEVRPDGYGSGAEGDQNIDYKRRNSYNLSIGVSQIIDKRLQVMAVVEPSYQEGLLSTPYHRVYFTDGTLKVEKLPGTRAKLPVGLRASYFLGDRFIIRSFYRYYQDNWGMKAHTISVEVPVKITSFVSVTPHYRFNSQTAVDYFAPINSHKLTETYYTSDFDISDFRSAFWGAGVRIAPPDGVLGIKHWNTAELRYGHYNRSNGMVAHIITLSAKFK